MATKKTTTKKATTKKTIAKKTISKKPATKKATTRRVITKKTTTIPVVKKAPAVIVKENVIKKDSCGVSTCTKVRSIMIALLLIINTALLCFIAFKTTTNTSLFAAMEEFEAMRVGGQENHQIMKEIYGLDAYQNDQKMRLETTLNALKQMDLNIPTQ